MKPTQSCLHAVELYIADQIWMPFLALRKRRRINRLSEQKYSCMWLCDTPRASSIAVRCKNKFHNCSYLWLACGIDVTKFHWLPFGIHSQCINFRSSGFHKARGISNSCFALVGSHQGWLSFNVTGNISQILQRHLHIIRLSISNIYMNTKREAS